MQLRFDSKILNFEDDFHFVPTTHSIKICLTYTLYLKNWSTVINMALSVWGFYYTIICSTFFNLACLYYQKAIGIK